MQGLAVTSFNENSSPAQKAGLLLGDILVQCDGHALTSVDLLIELMNEKSGQEVAFMLLRAGRIEMLSFFAGKLGALLVAKDITEDFHKAILSYITLSTTPNLDGYQVVETIDVISAECVFGMNLFKDFFASVTDVFGGRSKATQGVLRDARKACLGELRVEAFELGADAVVGVDLDYSEISGGGKSMIFLVASGTAVKLKKLHD